MEEEAVDDVDVVSEEHRRRRMMAGGGSPPPPYRRGRTGTGGSPRRSREGFIYYLKNIYILIII
jgi:hypothetical protein